MGRPKKVWEPLPPIWEAPDELWAMVEPILAEHDPPKRGTKRIDQRRALDAAIFRMRSGCQWNCGAASAAVVECVDATEHDHAELSAGGFD